jgi:excisionase family DNA binding protein
MLAAPVPRAVGHPGRVSWDLGGPAGFAGTASPEHYGPQPPSTASNALTSETERELLVRELYGPEAVPEALDGRLLRTREVALLFQVSERAVTDWATKGRIPSVRTPGGHRRYPAHLVRQLLDEAGGSDTA